MAFGTPPFSARSPAMSSAPDSDIDILIDLDPVIVATIFDYAGVKDYVASLFLGPVDVVDREALKTRVRSRVASDAIYAF